MSHFDVLFDNRCREDPRFSSLENSRIFPLHSRMIYLDTQTDSEPQVMARYSLAEKYLRCNTISTDLLSQYKLQYEMGSGSFGFVLSAIHIARHFHVAVKFILGVSFLYSLGIIHGDLKDENILNDEKMNIRIIDFGSVSYFDFNGSRPAGLFRGTLLYAAPEILFVRQYSARIAEVWALGWGPCFL